MKIQSIALVTVFATFVSATAPTAVLAAGPEASLQTITPAFAHAITNVPGKTLTALVVTYPPGGKTPPHRHGQAFVVGYYTWLRGGRRFEFLVMTRGEPSCGVQN